MLIAVLIATLAVVNLGAVTLLYLQHRQAAREREAGARMAVEIYTAADGAIRKSAELVETLTAAHAQLQQDRLALLEALRAVNLLRPQLLQSLADELLRDRGRS